MARQPKFPVKVRQAQKLVYAGKAGLSAIAKAIGVEPNKELVLSSLARLSAKDPNQLIHEAGANPPRTAQHLFEEQMQEGDRNTDSQENSQPQVRGSRTPQISSGGGEGQDCSETGSAMSGSNSKSHAGQSSAHQPDNSSSTALEEGDRTDGNGTDQGDQSRDAGALEGSDSLLNATTNAPDSKQSGEGDQAGDASTKQVENGSGQGDKGGEPNNQPADDRLAHQKKWGKKFNYREKKSHGGVTAQLDKTDIEHSLVQLCRIKLGALIGDNCQNPSHRRDYAEFCTRLKTYRNPNPARKEEEGRPVILIMADVSGSCSAFSGEALKVAKAASRLGVAGADILVLSHSNGSPEQMELNGKAIGVDIIDFSQEPFDYEYLNWYNTLLRQYQIEVVVALGDWDAVNVYEHLVNQPQIQRLIWLDNAYCSRGVKDQTSLALSQLKGKGIKHKLKYTQGCRDAKQFVQNIK